MINNEKTISLSIAFAITIPGIFVLYTYLPETYKWGIMIGLFLINLLVIYFILNQTIFKKIKALHLILEKIKKKEYELSTQKINIQENSPFNQIKLEIIEFAEKKQVEIEELKKLETFRREFLADVSHELKTPLFAAQGFVHTLIDGAIDDINVRDKFLTKAANSLDGLNILIQDLITISQLEIGEIKMHHQSFDILRLAEEIVYQLEESASSRKTKILFYKYNPKSCYVLADKLRMSQVLTNLIVNAIKYGKENGTVTIKFLIEDHDVEISISDDGYGIEEKHLTRIFERFYRIEKSRSKDKGGSGLGLSIVKHIIEAHHSKIEVKSELNVGTTFTFRLKKGKVINDEISK